MWVSHSVMCSSHLSIVRIPQVCARCCWRLSGRTGPCKVPDVSRITLLDAVAAALAGPQQPAVAATAAAPALQVRKLQHHSRSSACHGGVHRLVWTDLYDTMQAAPSTAASGAAPHVATGSAADTATAACPPVPQTTAADTGAASRVTGTVLQPAEHASAHAGQGGGGRAPAPLQAVTSGTPAARNGRSAEGDADAASAAPEPACPLCLGILQSLDARGSLPAGGRAVALPETDAGGGTWHLAAGGAAAQLAQVVRCASWCCLNGIVCDGPVLTVCKLLAAQRTVQPFSASYSPLLRRQEGHETVQCSLGISVPAATQLRQAAALHALRAAFPDAAWLADLATVSERIIDVKSALRQALAPQLGRALGWQVRGYRNTQWQLTRLHLTAAGVSPKPANAARCRSRCQTLLTGDVQLGCGGVPDVHTPGQQCRGGLPLRAGRRPQALQAAPRGARAHEESIRHDR